MSGTAYWLLLHSVTEVPNRKNLIREDLFGFMVSEMEQRNLRPGSFTDSLGAFKVLRLAIRSSITGPFVSLHPNMTFYSIPL